MECRSTLKRRSVNFRSTFKSEALTSGSLTQQHIHPIQVICLSYNGLVCSLYGYTDLNAQWFYVFYFNVRNVCSMVTVKQTES